MNPQSWLDYVRILSGEYVAGTTERLEIGLYYIHQETFQQYFVTQRLINNNLHTFSLCSEHQ